MGKTIGLLTTGLWHSFSRELFSGVWAGAQKHGMTLLAFLGNELRSRTSMAAMPELANSVYSLVSSRRVDGLVVWTGNLGNYVSQEELQDFLTGFDMPIVTIGRQVLDYPNIIQDEEAGSRLVMDHLLDHHGSRRVLFLRGPAAHQGCEFRYQGYRRALTDRGIAVDERLVFPALRGWEEINTSYLRLVDEPPGTPGSNLDPERLFGQVLAERGLVPVRDFDTIVAATDILAAIAIRQLNQLGYLVPSDVRVVGLDGDVMARDILPQTLSTLPLNLPEQGEAAVEALAARWEGGPAEFLFTVSRPHLGTSCGCLPPRADAGEVPQAEALRRVRGQEFLDLWVRCTKTSPPLPGPDAVERLRFLWSLDPPLSDAVRQDAETWVQQVIAEGRTHTARQKERRTRVLFDIGQSLSARFDRHSMSEALLTHLPRIGLRSFSLALYVDPARPEAGLEVFAAWTPAGTAALGRLESARLADDSFFDPLKGRPLVIQALYFSGGLLGLLVAEHTEEFDLEFYHHVGTQLSVALKGTLLKEEVTANLETLAQAQLNLREKEKLAVLGGLAAGVVHEVNTPLGAILSVNGQLESLTADLAPAVVAASPFLAPIQNRLETFLLGLSVEWIEDTRSRVLRRALKEELTSRGVADAAEEQARFLGELGFESVPEGWSELTGDPAGAVFRLIVLLTDIRRSAAINTEASSKMENYLKAIRSYIYRDRNHGASAVDLCRTIDTVLTLNSSQLAKSLTVERQYRSQPQVQGWSEALIQVWNNLVSNALFAMGGAGRLLIEVDSEGGEAVVRLTDSGPGIPPDIRQRIFEDFFTTKPVGIGTGLGLGIVRQVVHDHHGTIAFESEPGRTCFTVRLPALPLSPS